MIRPLILMVVFTFAFNNVGNVQTGSDAVPYPIFAYAGLMFWTYFAQTTTQVGGSLLTFQNIMKKIYFPRLMVPVSIAITGLIDFAFSLVIYLGLMFYYGITPEPVGLLMFLPMVLLTFIASLGVGMFMAALNIKYRDIQQVLPFFIQALLFLTPVVYPVSVVSEQWQWVLFLNPMTGVVDTMQAGLLGLRDIQWDLLAISVVSGLLILIISLVFFKAREREFADLI